MVNDVTGGKLFVDILNGNAHFHHQHHNVIRKVSDFVNCLLFVVRFSGDDNLGAFLTDFFEDLINALLEKVGCVRSLGQCFLAAFQKRIQVFKRKLRSLLALPDKVVKARIRAGVTGRSVLFNDNRQGVLVTVGGDRNDVLLVTACFALEPKLLP